MAWELKKVEEQRKTLIKEYEAGEAGMASLCRRYGVSRKTGYKWLNRYQEHGEKGLLDLSRAPHNPHHLYDEWQIDLALQLKLHHPKWGPKKILACLKKDHPEERWPSCTRLYEIYKSLNLTKTRRIRRRVPATNPLGALEGNNDTWIADFKGWFRTLNKEICEPLTISDAHSRYLISCVHMVKKKADHVWQILERAFEENGLPKRLRTDNGPPFGSRGAGRLTKLSVNLIKAGVQPEWINPGHPEENGRHERFHLTLKDAIADPPARTLKEQIRLMKEFIEEYNYDRPHEALEMQTPGSCYSYSLRKWDGRLRSPEYDTRAYLVRKVGQSGSLWFRGEEYYVSTTLVGEYVGIKETEEGHKMEYGPIYLGKMIKGILQIPKLKKKAIIRRG